MEIVKTKIDHLETLKSWFPDEKSSYYWGGPGLRYPFTKETFLEDIYWERMPAFSLVNNENKLIGFGQYYEKVGRCHLARLVISPPHRSRGLGYSFISKLMEIGTKELGVNSCSLFVLNYNKKALKCYHALKFRKTEYPPGNELIRDIDFMVNDNA